jgi:putative ABC transport system ATP-binding protein
VSDATGRHDDTHQDKHGDRDEDRYEDGDRHMGSRTRGRDTATARDGHSVPEGGAAAAGDEQAWVLRARGLDKHYGQADTLVRAVDGVDLDIAPGETVAIMGPSGCGKSTLLHLLGGLDRPSGGEVWIGDRRIDHLGEKDLARMRRRTVGFVFQAFHLMDELTAVENVELSALLAGTPPKSARRRATELLDRVGLADRAGFLPTALSGGQRQRVAVARALSNEPLLVLADEPTGNLDSSATVEVLRLFDALHEAGQTLVIVTHDERIAATADRLILMRDGAFVDETRLTGGTGGTGTGSRGAGGSARLGALAGLEG